MWGIPEDDWENKLVIFYSLVHFELCIKMSTFTIKKKNACLEVLFSLKFGTFRHVTNFVRQYLFYQFLNQHNTKHHFQLKLLVCPNPLHLIPVTYFHENQRYLFSKLYSLFQQTKNNKNLWWPLLQNKNNESF